LVADHDIADRRHSVAAGAALGSGRGGLAVVDPHPVEGLPLGVAGRLAPAENGTAAVAPPGGAHPLEHLKLLVDELQETRAAVTADAAEESALAPRRAGAATSTAPAVEPA